MYLFYIDESGNTGAHVHPTEPVHWLVAIAVHSRALRSVEAEMYDLALSFFGKRARDTDFEFHGADLFSGRRECNGLDPVARVELYRSLVALVRRHGCTLFVRGIDKSANHAAAAAAAAGRRPAHPHAMAFQLLVERIDAWLDSHQPPFADPALDPVLGLLVADEQKEVDREMVRCFACWRAMGEPDTHLSWTIRYLVDTVHYVPSTDSWLLQLTDCVTYLRNRYEKIVRGKICVGQELTPADREIVSLWEEFCRPAVESEMIWP